MTKFEANRLLIFGFLLAGFRCSLTYMLDFTVMQMTELTVKRAIAGFHMTPLNFKLQNY